MEERLLLALVSRSCRALVAEPVLWRVVSLATGSGVGRASNALLRAVSKAASGSIVELDVSQRWGVLLSTEALQEVVRSSAANLRRLRVLDRQDEYTLLDDLASLLEPLGANHGVVSIDADVTCTAAESRAVLRCEPPLGALRVRCLQVCGAWGGAPRAEAEAALLALAEDLAAYRPSTLSSLLLEQFPLESVAALTAVVGVVVSRRLTSLRLRNCSLDAAGAVPPLARLLRDGRLADFGLEDIDYAFVSSAGHALGSALRASTLTRRGAADGDDTCRTPASPSPCRPLPARTPHCTRPPTPPALQPAAGQRRPLA